METSGRIDREQTRRLAVEPDDLALRAQNDDAVGQRGGGMTQLAVQLHQALLVVLLTAVQAHHLGNYVAPDAADVRRADLRTQSQPTVEAIQIRATIPKSMRTRKTAESTRR